MRGFQPVAQSVAQHVLERRADSLEHAAVELDLAAFDLQLGLLADLARRLPHDAVQALVKVRKRHRAHAHQLLLHVAADARLLQQAGVGFAEVLQQGLLDRRGVVQALRHHPRQLLQPRITVELERIEVAVALFEHRPARLHLAVGLDLDFAQLTAQARDAVFQIAQRLLHLPQLRLDARACDGDLTRFGDQVIEGIGVDPQQRRGTGQRRLGPGRLEDRLEPRARLRGERRRG